MKSLACLVCLLLISLSLVCNAAHNKACSLKKDPGNCEDASTKWYYDSKSNSCRLFVYGGCDGNDNRFDTEAKCKAACVPGIRQLGQAYGMNAQQQNEFL